MFRQHNELFEENFFSRWSSHMTSNVKCPRRATSRSDALRGFETISRMSYSLRLSCILHEGRIQLQGVCGMHTIYMNDTHVQMLHNLSCSHALLTEHVATLYTYRKKEMHTCMHSYSRHFNSQLTVNPCQLSPICLSWFRNIVVVRNVKWVETAFATLSNSMI